MVSESTRAIWNGLEISMSQQPPSENIPQSRHAPVYILAVANQDIATVILSLLMAVTSSHQHACKFTGIADVMQQ
eukprot:813303-Amphidinium_carterae.1